MSKYAVVTHFVQGKLHLRNWYLVQSGQQEKWFKDDQEQVKTGNYASAEIEEHSGYDAALRSIESRYKYCKEDNK